jgi:hypothetical protein
MENSNTRSAAALAGEACRPVHEDVAAERLAAEGALVQELVRLLGLRVGDAEHGRRAARGRGAPAVLRRRPRAALRGAPRPVGLRAAAGEHRREVRVAERVEAGRRELHPAGAGVPQARSALARAGRSRSCHTAHGRRLRTAAGAWREEGAEGLCFKRSQRG